MHLKAQSPKHCMVVCGQVFYNSAELSSHEQLFCCDGCEERGREQFSSYEQMCACIFDWPTKLLLAVSTSDRMYAMNTFCLRALWGFI